MIAEGQEVIFHAGALNDFFVITGGGRRGHVHDFAAIFVLDIVHFRSIGVRVIVALASYACDVFTALHVVPYPPVAIHLLDNVMRVVFVQIFILRYVF